MGKRLKIASWNINSVRARTALVERLVKEQQPDILCLQETKVLDGIFPADLFDRHGYVHRQLNGQRMHHGVAILSRVPLKDPGTELLDRDPDTARGRPSSIDEQVERALDDRDAGALDALAETYDQAVPEPDAAARLRRLAGTSGPIVGYLGKLIPQKGVELMLQANRAADHEAHTLVVGFGSYREWLAALAIALERGDGEALAWLREVREIPIEAGPHPRPGAGERDVTFTGRLDHRYAPEALAAMDVMVVPSILPEAFGMVAAEGAAAGALPLVARHSGLGEVGAALEAAIGRPGLLTFEPGPRAIARLAAALDRVLELPATDRDELRATVSAFVGREWTWDRTAKGLLAAAGLDSPDRRADADPT